MPALYPLKFKTIFKDKIWGGDKIRSYLGKEYAPLPNCGETWEISGVKTDVSVVANGDLAGEPLSALVEKYKGELVGSSVYTRFGNDFPLLVKFIDAHDDLSIQVHPNDELAKKRHNSLGKTEMWYIIEADPGSTLISGFNREVNEQIYLDKLNSGHLTDLLNREKAVAGDVFFLPAGRVHTIGKGLLLAEIQQTSDITYRIYDFDRVDANGNKRELHTDLALAAIDYTFYPEYKTQYSHQLNEVANAVTCRYFTTNVLNFTHTEHRDYTAIDSFVIHICVEGAYSLVVEGQALDMKMGDCVLIPASMREVKLETETGFKVLETYVG